jgi:hypothetical protein
VLDMPLLPQQTLELVTGRGVSLGRALVERVEDGLVFAQFIPSGNYGEVKALFDEFEEAVNQQMFTVADEAATAITALGLCLRPADGPGCVPVHDVQIMNTHDLSCRLTHITTPASAHGCE